MQLFCLTPTLCVPTVSHECSLLVVIPSMFPQQFHLFLCPFLYLLNQSEVYACFLYSELVVNYTSSDRTLWIFFDLSLEPGWVGTRNLRPAGQILGSESSGTNLVVVSGGWLFAEVAWQKD